MNLFAGSLRFSFGYKNHRITMRACRRGDGASLPVDCNLTDAGRLREVLRVGIAWQLHGALHELGPDRGSRGASAQFQVAVIVVADPNDGQQTRRVAGEPGVVRCPGLPGCGKVESPSPYGIPGAAIE